jgi:S-adenosylmethionine-diacylglycerol 3-amino-3-carboxypropyl transferase
MLAQEFISKKAFGLIHGNNLIYNQCWEDPRLDRQALKIKKDDTLLVITSAGCNTLDYALENPQRIHAIDMNPKQNALLELKIAGIRNLDYNEFFAIFGLGRLDGFKDLYFQKLRPFLSPLSQAFWDKNYVYFEGNSWRPSFYFRGTSGLVARFLNYYIDIAKIRSAVASIFEAKSLDEQKRIYFEYLKPEFWNALARWVSGQESVMYLLGVPRSQFLQIQKGYHGGLPQFIEDCFEAVFAELPLSDNYFWWLYFNGAYTIERCPEYLKEVNFNKLKSGMVDKIVVHTSTILDFLHSTNEKISKFILLDHMDWLYSHQKQVLWEEWQAIMDKTAEGGRAIWRSAGLHVNFIDPIMVTHKGQKRKMSSLLSYKRDLAHELHKQDRVHTYGSFYIADILA